MTRHAHTRRTSAQLNGLTTNAAAQLQFCWDRAARRAGGARLVRSPSCPPGGCASSSARQIAFDCRRVHVSVIPGIARPLSAQWEARTKFGPGRQSPFHQTAELKVRCAIAAPGPLGAWAGGGGGGFSAACTRKRARRALAGGRWHVTSNVPTTHECLTPPIARRAATTDGHRVGASARKASTAMQQLLPAPAARRACAGRAPRAPRPQDPVATPLIACTMLVMGQGQRIRL